MHFIQVYRDFYEIKQTFPSLPLGQGSEVEHLKLTLLYFATNISALLNYPLITDMAPTWL